MPSAAVTEPADLVRAFLAAMEARDLATARSFLGEGFAMTFPGGVRMSTLDELVAFAAPRYRFVSKTYEGFEVVDDQGAPSSLSEFVDISPPVIPGREAGPEPRSTTLARARMSRSLRKAEAGRRRGTQPAGCSTDVGVSGFRARFAPRNDGGGASFSPDAKEHAVVYCFGTLSGEWPDGTAFSHIRFIDRFEIENGLIVRQDVWNDLAEIRSRRTGEPA